MKKEDFKTGIVIKNKVYNDLYVVINLEIDEHTTEINLASFDEMNEQAYYLLPVNLGDVYCDTIDLKKNNLNNWELVEDEKPFRFIETKAFIISRSK